MTQEHKNRANDKRLESLDILRGFDLFMLVFFQPVFMALVRELKWPFLDPIVKQFGHVHWEGFAAWDIIMPLFMFMAGVSMPFSLNKYVGNNQGKGRVYIRIFKRFILLFFLGMIVQGNLLSLDADRVYLYSNTLQAIATGYIITALIYLWFNVKGVIIGIIALLVIYWLPMSLCGDFTPDGNFAEYIDRAILGRFRDGATLNDDGTWNFSPYYRYTWIWSSLNFAVTVMLGFITGNIMKKYSTDGKKILKKVVVTGILLVLSGLALSGHMPIIKKIWSSSMTLFSGGICMLLMALFYYIVDYKGWGRGLAWLKIYGMNSIAAYMLGQVINFRCVAHSVTHGLQQFMGDYYDVWLTFANYLILFFILRAMYKSKIFLKV